jgi:DNA-binding NtrC family response regulator
MASDNSDPTGIDARRLLRNRVVIVEDEPDLAEAFQLILERHGFQVTVLGNGSFDALISSCPKAPQLLICDMNLPGGSGAELCKMVLERYPQCEVVLMTGSVDVPDAVSVRGGFRMPVLLHKPFPLAKLVELAVALTANYPYLAEA